MELLAWLTAGGVAVESADRGPLGRGLVLASQLLEGLHLFVAVSRMLFILILPSLLPFMRAPVDLMDYSLCVLVRLLASVFEVVVEFKDLLG